MVICGPGIGQVDAHQVPQRAGAFRKPGDRRRLRVNDRANDDEAALAHRPGVQNFELFTTCASLEKLAIDNEVLGRRARGDGASVRDLDRVGLATSGNYRATLARQQQRGDRATLSMTRSRALREPTSASTLMINEVSTVVDLAREGIPCVRTHEMGFARTVATA